MSQTMRKRMKNVASSIFYDNKERTKTRGIIMVTDIYVIVKDGRNILNAFEEHRMATLYLYDQLKCRRCEGCNDEPYKEPDFIDREDHLYSIVPVALITMPEWMKEADKHED